MSRSTPVVTRSKTVARWKPTIGPGVNNKATAEQQTSIVLPEIDDEHAITSWHATSLPFADKPATKH